VCILLDSKADTATGECSGEEHPLRGRELIAKAHQTCHLHLHLCWTFNSNPPPASLASQASNAHPTTQGCSLGTSQLCPDCQTRVLLFVRINLSC
jgi:hypothetical protein